MRILDVEAVVVGTLEEKVGKSADVAAVGLLQLLLSALEFESVAAAAVGVAAANSGEAELEAVGWRVEVQNSLDYSPVSVAEPSALPSDRPGTDSQHLRL